MFDRETVMFLMDLGVRGLAIVLFTVGLYLVRKYNLEKWVRTAVWAAEQIFNAPGMGKEKKKWVLEFVAKSINYYISADELDVLIESIVAEINSLKARQN